MVNIFHRSTVPTKPEKQEESGKDSEVKPSTKANHSGCVGPCVGKELSYCTIVLHCCLFGRHCIIIATKRNCIIMIIKMCGVT